jgi:GDP-L-fucose synthase
LNYLYLIPNTLYGPGYHTDGRQQHFIFDLTRKILRGRAFGEHVRLWGDGYQKRELVYVTDFVNAAIQLAGLNSDETVNEIINVGSGSEYTIRWYAERICDLVQYDPAEIYYDTSRYTGVRSKQLAIEKLKSLLPTFEPTPIDAGLERTVRWYESTERLALSAASI